MDFVQTKRNELNFYVIMWWVVGSRWWVVNRQSSIVNRQSSIVSSSKHLIIFIPSKRIFEGVFLAERPAFEGVHVEDST